MTGVRNQEMKLDLINFYAAFLIDECTVVCTLFNIETPSRLQMYLIDYGVRIFVSNVLHT